MEATLALIKPDGVAEKHVGKVIDLIEKNGLAITALKMTRLSPFHARAFYKDHAGKPFFKDLVDFTTSGPVVAMVLVGEEAVSKWRSLMGATNPAEADPDTIRGMYGSKEVIRYNVVHGSDSVQSASFEIRFFFNCFEL